MEGYLGYKAGDPEPGPNRSPGFRWGWANRKRDAQREDNGFDGVRRGATGCDGVRRAHIESGRMKRLWAV